LEIYLNIHIKTQEGIGDIIYQLAFIRILAENNTIYLETALPKIFKHLPNIKFIATNKQTYRTQEKERVADDTEYSVLPDNIDRYIAPHYLGDDIKHSSIVHYFYKAFDIPSHTPLDWSLPDFSKELDAFNLPIPKYRKIAIIRPATIRGEWQVSSRNANPNYIAWTAKMLNEAGYFTISIADLAPHEEWLADDIDTPSQLKLHKGELGIYCTLELLKRASIVVGGSGFIVPATVAAGANLFVIFGGRMSFDSPSRTLHPAMDLKKIGWASPQNPCRCTQANHSCDKSIPNLEDLFFNFLREIQ
jgi:ADP-heptose:LPS heptosyltransferase